MTRSWKTPPGSPVQLNTTERNLADEIQTLHASIMKRALAHEKVERSELDVMGAKAHKLHMLLKQRGKEPRHHRFMRKNRGVSTDDATFYNHVHPVEDLLGFLEDDHSNDDPVDATLDHPFKFRVYSRRWGHDDIYTVTRTKSGWLFSHPQEVPTGRDGRVGGKDGTGLFHLLDHDSINYPAELPGYFEWLWDQAADRGLTAEEVQGALNQLSEWVVVCEKGSPDGIFEHFK